MDKIKSAKDFIKFLILENVLNKNLKFSDEELNNKNIKKTLLNTISKYHPDKNFNLTLE